MRLRTCARAGRSELQAEVQGTAGEFQRALVINSVVFLGFMDVQQQTKATTEKRHRKKYITYLKGILEFSC